MLDGRDIGTVIAPDATAKLFVTATPEVRAQRRVRELLERGMPAHYEDVLIDIRARDARDSGRDAAPLRQADDADLLDTSEMDVDEAIAAAIELVEAKASSPVRSGRCGWPGSALSSRTCSSCPAIRPSALIRATTGGAHSWIRAPR